MQRMMNRLLIRKGASMKSAAGTEPLLDLRQGADYCRCSPQTFRDRVLPLTRAIDLARPGAKRRRLRFTASALNDALVNLECSVP